MENTGKKLMNLGLKLAGMLKDKLMVKVRQAWKEMQFTESEKKTLKELVSKKEKREEIFDQIRDEIAQRLSLSETSGKQFGNNLEEEIRKLKEVIRKLEENKGS